MSFLTFSLLAVAMARPVGTLENHVKNAKSSNVESPKVSIQLL